jgi:hypothetical protein
MCIQRRGAVLGNTLPHKSADRGFGPDFDIS